MTNNDTNILVSVIMPAYNAEAYLESAILSVIEQTYQNWELYILDDGSTDLTLKIAEKYCRIDNRVKLIKNACNLGVAETRNRGLDLCRGKYVALIDSDDIWERGKLTKQLECADETHADIVYCSYGIVDKNGKKICEDFIVPYSTNYHDSMIRTVISCSTVLMSREIIEKYRFNPDYYHEDFVLWLEILRDGYKACGVQDVLAYYRVIQGSRAYNKLKSARERWKILRDHFNISFSDRIDLIGRYAICAMKKYKRII